MASFPRARPPPAPTTARRLRNAAADAKKKITSSVSPLTAIVAGVVALAVFFAPNLHDLAGDAAGMLSGVRQALSRPIINDVSTDLTDPPAFSEASGIGAMPEANKGIIRRAYPDLRPLVVPPPLSKADAFAALEELARSRDGWEVTDVDAEGGTLQGVATTRVLRFKDDFVFRVSTTTTANPSGGKDNVVVVDARSRSRVGKGDLGANAARIEGALRDLERALASKSSESQSAAAATS